jgi:hypothetical protein
MGGFAGVEKDGNLLSLLKSTAVDTSSSAPLSRVGGFD